MHAIVRLWPKISPFGSSSADDLDPFAVDLHELADRVFGHREIVATFSPIAATRRRVSLSLSDKNRPRCEKYCATS